jgi:hypothetical protein
LRSTPLTRSATVILAGRANLSGSLRAPEDGRAMGFLRRGWRSGHSSADIGMWTRRLADSEFRRAADACAVLADID